MSSVSKARLKKNIAISIGAQFVSIVVSILLNLIVPKFLPEIQYAYWQTYLLYAGYVGILHFGLLDGLMLRYSQYDYDELDKTTIRSQFKLLLILLALSSFITIIIGYSFSDSITSSVFYFIAIAIFSKNLYTYTSYSFQMTNRINEYALFVILQRVLYLIGIVFLLMFGVQWFVWFCVVDVLADLISCCFGSIFNKGLYLGKSLPVSSTLTELKLNIQAGMILLGANWSSMLIVGASKMFIQWHWTPIQFAKVSFAFSVSNLFLTFVTAISVVLFPALKRTSPEELPLFYSEIRNKIDPVLFSVIALYFPGNWILNIWLPNYSESLPYLGLLLPTIVFSSKVSLLTNNYLKALRKEKILLYINLFSVLFAVALYIIATYLINSILCVLIGVVAVVFIRSIISELYVGKKINQNYTKSLIVESLLTLIFISLVQMHDTLVAFSMYCLVLIVVFAFPKLVRLYKH